MFIQEEKEAQKQVVEAVQVVETTQKARDLARKILEAKEYKALLDKEIKEATEELTEIANKNPDWFKDENGKFRKSCNLGAAKLVWKTASPVYNFNEKNKELIGKFIDDYPSSIGFTFKNMQNIDLAAYGIEVKTNEAKLVVEKSDDDE
jgi:threonyl-tRNA synthetase